MSDVRRCGLCLGGKHFAQEGVAMAEWEKQLFAVNLVVGDLA